VSEAQKQSSPEPPNGSRQATMKDVASRAGVAVSSVSRVLSGNPDVSPVMRNRVLDAVAALGYQKDLLAQGMRSGATFSVGFMALDIANPIIAASSAGAIRELREHGYTLLISSSSGSSDLDADYIRNFHLRRVEGLMLAVADEEDPSTVNAITQFPGAVVLLDRTMSLGRPTSAVLYDHRSGMTDAVEHLLKLGHRRLALINGAPRVRPARERASAVRQAVRRQSDASVVVRGGSYTAEHGYEATRQLLKGDEAPTAIIVGGNQILQGVMRAVKEMGMSVPDDVSLITADNVPLAEFISPSLACVTRDPVNMGSVAAKLVLELIAGNPVRTVELPTVFVAGESCARPKELAVN
jgi:LacI family transcriptional regulator